MRAYTHTRSCLSIKLTNLNLNCLTPLKKSKLTSHFSEISSLCPEHKTSTYAKRARSLAKLLLYKKHPLPLLRTFLHHFKTRSSFHLALNTLFAPLPSETELPWGLERNRKRWADPMLWLLHLLLVSERSEVSFPSQPWGQGQVNSSSCVLHKACTSWRLRIRSWKPRESLATPCYRWGHWDPNKGNGFLRFLGC